MLTESQIIAAQTYKVCQDSLFIRFGADHGIIANINGAKYISGALYLDTLSVCQEKPGTVFELIERLKQSYNSTYVWHAINVLIDLEYMEIVEESGFDKYEIIRELPADENLDWTFCPKEDIPIVTIVADIDSQDARLAYKVAQQANRNWLPVVVGGMTPFIGPVFTSDGPCLECLCFRLRENNSVYAWIKQNASEELTVPERIEKQKFLKYKNALKQFASEWSPTGALKNRLISLASEYSMMKHMVVKRPECVQCGDPFLMGEGMLAPVEPIYSIQYLDYRFGYRSMESEETWRNLVHHISPVTGIVGQISAIENTNVTRFPVYCSGFSTISGEKPPPPGSFTMPVFGKGRTMMDAKVSALCEGIERASVRYRGDEPIETASIKEMGPHAIAPSAIQHFSPEQFLNSDETESLGPVPSPMIQDEPIDWIPGWSLTFNERRFLPADTVLYQRPSSRKRVAVFESNGLSAGNTIEEAILQGFMELIERDAVSIWWFNRLRRPSFDINLMAKDNWYMNTISNLKKEKVEVSLLDLTIDTKIPVVAAIGKFQDGWISGFGCHFDPRLAASRALSELVQVRSLIKPAKPPKGFTDLDYLVPDSNAKVINQEKISYHIATDASAFVKYGLGILSEIGIDTIVVNCTRPDIGLPVVKVFAPGLRAFRPRFGPGRLYDTPVRLGLLNQPVKAEELTPFWMTK